MVYMFLFTYSGVSFNSSATTTDDSLFGDFRLGEYYFFISILVILF